MKRRPLPITRKVVAALQAAAEQREQAAIEAALFTAQTDEERQLVLQVLRVRAENRRKRASE